MLMLMLCFCWDLGLSFCRLSYSGLDDPFELLVSRLSDRGRYWGLYVIRGS